MKIVTKKTSELKQYENNPRINDDAVQYVAESIAQFGFKVPIVIDTNDIIVAGHTRLEAAKSLNIDEVPCIVADDLSDEQVKAFRLADNKVAELAEWDYELLRKELEKISEFDMSDFGFTDVESIDLEDFFDDYEPEPKEPKMIECPYCKEFFEKK